MAINATEIPPAALPSPYFSVIAEYSNDGYIEIMDNYQKGNDYADLKSIARLFAMAGSKVQILAPVHHKDLRYKRIFGALTGTRYNRKCPDLIIDGKFYEYESYIPPFKKRKISNMISAGIKQSSRIIINNNKGVKHRWIERNVFYRVAKNLQAIDEVWVYEKGNVYLVYKTNRECKTP
jgi:hypothetical protein